MNDTVKSWTLITPLSGHWVSGKHARGRCRIVDVVAGRVYAAGDDGGVVSGPASNFVSDSGASGEALLAEVLLPPPSSRLFRGAVREALATAHATARIGFGETHGWERPLDYVVDDNEGNVGIVRFLADGAVAAICHHESTRRFNSDAAVAAAHPHSRDALAQLCRLPLLNGPHPISAVFWTEGELLRGPEAWSQTYLHGAELFRREFLNDVEWMEEGAVHHGLPADAASLVEVVASRARADIPLLSMTEQELRTIVPPGSEFERDALSLLQSDGMFGLPDPKPSRGR